MNLQHPLFVDLDGKPIIGRPAPRVIILGDTRTLTEGQKGAVAHEYNLFYQACQSMVGEYMVMNKVLRDGTQVRMTSWMKQDAVYVTPPAVKDGGSILAHGFVVDTYNTDWRAPFFYMRNITSTPTWSISPLKVLQTGIEDARKISAYNQVARSGILPLVHSDKLWDCAHHTAPTLGLPFALSIDGEEGLTHPAHFAKDTQVINHTGDVLFTTAAVYTVEGGMVIQGMSPPITDGTGRRLAFSNYQVGGSIGEHMQCIFEIVKRTAATAYTQVEFSTALLPNVTNYQTAAGSGNTDTSGSGVVPPGDVNIVYLITPTLGSEDSGLGYDDLFVLGYHEVTYGPGALTGTGWSTHYSRAAGSAVVLNNVLALPTGNASDPFEKLSITYNLNYPLSEEWHDGQSILEHEAPSGESSGIYLYRSAGTTGSAGAYSMDGAPSVSFALGWMTLNMFEGVTTGRLLASSLDRATVTHSLGTVSLYGYKLIASTLDPFPHAGATTAEKHTYLVDNDIVGRVADLEALYPDGVNTHDVDTAPWTVRNSYVFTTRYIIDYDHRARFCAWLRVVVTCADANWDGDISGFAYTGGAYPNYNIKIYFDSNWQSVTASQLLYSHDSSHVPSEFELIDQYVGSGGETFGLQFRMPPRITPPMNAYKQLYETIPKHQGVNPCFTSQDYFTGDLAARQSKTGLEGSLVKDGKESAPINYVTGMLYARTITAAQFPNAFWITGICGVTPSGLSAMKWHIELKDGVLVNWSDNIPVATGDIPANDDRDLHLYKV